LEIPVTMIVKIESRCMMELLFVIVIFAGILAIYDLIRRVNNTILAQTEEIKKLREELKNKN